MQSQNQPGHPNQQQGHPQQQQQQQQQQLSGPPSAGQPTQNGQPSTEPQMSLAGVLHYLQTEWRRWERDRNEWEIERAEMRARIALLEGERRSTDNLKTDLSRRVKLLEFALRQERSKGADKQPASKSAAIPPGKLSAMQAEGAEGKDGSASSEAGSDDGPLLNGLRISTSPPPPGDKSTKEPVTRAGSIPPPAVNGQGPLPNWKTGVAAAGRDPKSRQRSRDYLKQCLQEVSYLTSPGALNPLPSRPIVLPPVASPSPSASEVPSSYAKADAGSNPGRSHEAVPTTLVPPRKTLSENPPASPNQGIPTSIQDSLDQHREQEEREEASKRDAHVKEMAALENRERLEHLSEQAETMSEGEIRMDTDARAIPDVNIPEEEARSATIDESTQQTLPKDAELQAAIDSSDASPPPSPPVEHANIYVDEDSADLSSDATFTSESVSDARNGHTQGLGFSDGAEDDDDDDDEAEEDEEALHSGPLKEDSSVQDVTSAVENATLEDQEEPEEEEEDGEEEESRLTAMFRPPDKAQWRDALNKAGSTISDDKVPVPSSPSSESTVPVGRSPEEELANFTLEDSDEDEDEDEISATNGTTSDVGSWRPALTLRSHVDAVRDVAFHPTEACVATASEDCTVKLWRLDLNDKSDESSREEPLPQVTFRGHSSAVTSVVFSPTRDVLYSGSLDASVRVWKVPAASKHSLYSPHDPSLNVATLVGHTDGVWDLAIVGASGERVLVSASADGTVKVWDAEMESTPLLLSWGYEGLEKDDAGDLETPDESARVVPTSVCAVGSDDTLVAVSYTNSIVKLFQARSGKEVLKFESDESYDGTCQTQINKIVTHPSRPILFSAHEDKMIRLMDISSGESTLALPAHSDGVGALAVSPLLPDTLASVGHDGSLRVWDLESHSSVQELALHRQNKDSGALGVAIHAQEKVLATAGADGTVRVLFWTDGPSAISNDSN